MANLYTATGDGGMTSLVGGSRVSKGDPRVECYGSMDEALSMLGLAYAQSSVDFVKEKIRAMQQRVFLLNAELASDSDGVKKLRRKIEDEDVKFLESVVDKCTEKTGMQRAFVIPGVNVPSSILHVARTIVRRAERALTRYHDSCGADEKFRPVLARFINRFSDAVYALARYEEEEAAECELRAKVSAIVREVLTNSSCPDMPPLTLEAAKAMSAAAEKRAAELGVPVVFAASDLGGNIILVHRMADSLLASIDIAINKAFTAAAMKMPTHELSSSALPDGSLYGINNACGGRIVTFGGGIPYVYNGSIVGAIGVSGGTVEEDIDIASYALNEIKKKG